MTTVTFETSHGEIVLNWMQKKHLQPLKTFLVMLTMVFMMALFFIA